MAQWKNRKEREREGKKDKPTDYEKGKTRGRNEPQAVLLSLSAAKHKADPKQGRNVGTHGSDLQNTKPTKAHPV